MMRRLFFSCDIDHRDLAPWGARADLLRRAARAACGRDVAVDIGDDPVWGPGVDFEETLAELEEMRFGRRVRIDLWSSVVHHSVLSLTLGTEIKRQERRALERKVRKALRGEKLLRTVEGPYSEDSALVFGYPISARDDAAARAAVEFLVMPIESPLYVGERWLVQGEDERIDEASYVHVAEPAPGLVTFFARSGEIAEELWRKAALGEGLIACYPDDEGLEAIVQRFHRFEDLRLLVADKPSGGLRVTIDRGLHGAGSADDDALGEGLVVAYAPAGAPEIDPPYVFVL